MRRGAAGLLAAIALAACGRDAPGRAVSDPVPVPSVTEPAPGTATTVAPPLGSGLTQPSFVIPAKLATGALTGLVGHKASGEAAIWRQPDASLIVRLEQFEVSNVGGLTVSLVPGRAVERIDAGVRLGRLTTHQGSVNVPIPAGTAVDPPVTVLIWSEESRLPVAHATATAS